MEAKVDKEDCGGLPRLNNRANRCSFVKRRIFLVAERAERKVMRQRNFNFATIIFTNILVIFKN